jgi:hypothetical protein
MQTEGLFPYWWRNRAVKENSNGEKANKWVGWNPKGYFQSKDIFLIDWSQYEIGRNDKICEMLNET